MIALLCYSALAQDFRSTAFLTMAFAICIFLALLGYVLGQGSRECPTEQLTVKTSTGTFTGVIDPEFPHTRQFRAVPFAKPPVASLRWMPPQKLEPTDSHHYATRFPPSCPQFVSGVPTFWNGDLTRGNLIYNGAQNDTSGLVGEATSEDCLYLAIWTPTLASNETTAEQDELLPVLFFMTGGGFYMGGVDIPWQMPTSWVERSRSHIVVTINYRVGIFGFPNARGLDDQNLGILDQRAALEWVRDNIAAFGGDPTRITQMGRSAGATSVDMHSYAWHDDPIAQAIYMQSGTVFSTNPLRFAPPAYSNFSFVARRLGCEPPCGRGGEQDEAERAAAELDCMRRLSYMQIVNFVGQYGDNGTAPPLTFAWTPDDRVVFYNYTARSEEGLIARVPYMMSVAANEWSSLVPWPTDNTTAGPSQSEITELNVESYVCPTLKSTVYRNRLGAETPVFRFQWAGTFPNLNVYEWLGAYHASDIPMFFGTYHLLDHVAASTEFQAQVSVALQDHILAFVKDPHQGPQREYGWLPMDASEPDGGHLLRFGAGGKAVQHIDGVEVDGVCLGLREYDPFPE